MEPQPETPESLAALIAKSLAVADALGLELVAIRLSEALDFLVGSAVDAIRN
jgi:hypothetical protein